MYYIFIIAIMIVLIDKILRDDQQVVKSGFTNPLQAPNRLEKNNGLQSKCPELVTFV